MTVRVNGSCAKMQRWRSIAVEQHCLTDNSREGCRTLWFPSRVRSQDEGVHLTLVGRLSSLTAHTFDSMVSSLSTTIGSACLWISGTQPSHRQDCL